jgi:putative hydroxymethylpyrimidine transport system substrate-binding protein
MVRDLVRRAGGQPDDVVLVDVGARELTSDELAAGAADATFGSYWAWGARADFAAAQSNLLDAFHDATDRGFRYAAEHPTETVEVLRDVTPYFTDEVITRSLKAISGTWFHDGHWGTIRRELVEPYAHWLAEHGILSTPERWHEALLDSSAAGAGTAT